MTAPPAPRRVTVVGGGVTGCAVAYELARAGCAVTLLERDGLAAHASGKNAGNLNPLHGTPAALLPLALDSFRRHLEWHEELSREPATRYVISPVRRLLLGFSEGERPSLDALDALFSRHPGFSAQWLDREALHAAEPDLAADAHMALAVSGSLSVDGRALTRALAAGATRLGGRLSATAVSGFATRADRVTGVHCGGATLDCDAVVLATGPWTVGLAAQIDVEVPVEPVKGQLLRLRAGGHAPLHDVTWGTTSIYRRGHGELWVGSTEERCGFDDTPTRAAREDLLQRAARIVPRLRAAEIEDQVAALRPTSLTGAPIAGRAPGWRNVYLASGGGNKGLLLCAGTARKIADLVGEVPERGTP